MVVLKPQNNCAKNTTKTHNLKGISPSFEAIIMQLFIHYGLHFIFPFFIAYVFFRKNWLTTYLMLIATMLIDLDHLLATPIFQANRCSIGFHPLHSYYAIAFYCLLLFAKKPFNIIGIGLIFHILTDLIDCLFMYHNCKTCFASAPALSLLKTLASWLQL